MDFITDLKQQSEKLNELILKLKQKEYLSEADLYDYDVTTQQIEKRLRTLRRIISNQLSKESK